ncbi:pancreatic lipase-related protein 2-like isoform X2 [Drosophila novamexicana]|uniref:pancreatic lipase-related protein 2-like isoform X2 n=1 Tax=Drosophila novamexicana TaxID=47314 RepID=UPI0011E5F675|nr:pancreatic lipase-related protein 2-like isoform X2 [Drosophila novamexicana]
MKVFLVLTALLAAGKSHFYFYKIMHPYVSATSGTSLSTKERIHGENGWYVPKIDGTREWMDLQKAKKLLVNDKRFLYDADVSFYLYTRSNPTNGEEISSSEESIYDSHFNKKHPTRFVIHGWTQSHSDSMNTKITRAWLARGDNNIIVVDWERARSVDYVSSVVAVPDTGVKSLVTVWAPMLLVMLARPLVVVVSIPLSDWILLCPSSAITSLIVACLPMMPSTWRPFTPMAAF